MERAQNYYCLRTLNDWLLAQEQGIVKKMIYFSDLPSQKRHEILSAQVSSIWIALDGNTEPLFPMK